MGGKTGSTTTTPNVDPGLTDEERRLVMKEVELADFKISQLEKQSEFQEDLLKSLPSQLEGEEEFLKLQREERERGRELQKKRGELELENLQQAQELLPFQTQIAERELEAFERGGRASPEELALIEKIAAEQEVIGQSELDASTQGIIDQIRGGAVPDSTEAGVGDAVVARLNATIEEGERQKRQLTRQIRSGVQEASLNFPLAKGQLDLNRGRNLAGLSQLSSQFQSELQQQAFINRLKLQQQVGGLGLGLARGVQASPGALGLGLRSNRVAAAGTTTKTKSPGQGAKIAGAGLGILGAVLAPFTAGGSLALTAAGAAVSAAG